MGLFDKMKLMAEKARDIMNDDTTGSGTGNIGSGGKGFAGYDRNNSLLTPPAPPIPSSKDSMSVRIAVNGKDYGPYERATLIEMIANGSLTPDTLVFMKGMSEWKPASQVRKVNELFSDGGDVPPVPPTPWANSNPETSGNQNYDNTLSPRLNQLINAAVADGEISDMERQVLVRNAQEEGVAMDEFVMVLEARLYAQRQVLQAQKEQREMQSNIARSRATLMSSDSKAPNAGHFNSLRKCPACGAILNDAAKGSCPECGYEFEIRNAYNPIQSLVDKLEELDREYSRKNPFARAFSESQFYHQKITVVSTFKLPDSKNAVLDFLSVAATAHGSCQFGDPTKKAWKKKMEEVISTARIRYPEDSDLLDSMRIIAKRVGIKVK